MDSGFNLLFESAASRVALKVVLAAKLAFASLRADSSEASTIASLALTASLPENICMSAPT